MKISCYIDDGGDECHWQKAWKKLYKLALSVMDQPSKDKFYDLMEEVE